MKRSTKIVAGIGTACILAALAGCNAADVASRNLSTAADNFEIMRDIKFVDTWTGETLLEIVGRCSIGNDNTATTFSTTCKVGPNKFKKHYLGLSGQVTWFAQQIDAAPADPWHYRVIWRPSAIIPHIQVSPPTGG